MKPGPTEDHPGPNRPSVAWVVMQPLLPAWWHHRPPPRSGVRLEVVGRDAVSTVWDLTESLAAFVVAHLRRHRMIWRIHGTWFEDRGDGS